MTDHLPDSDDLVEDPSTDELPSFDISLSPAGSEGTAFRTSNDPSDPYQRINVTQREGHLDMRCSFLDIVHGLFSAESDAFATLIVLQFRFDTSKRARRFAAVDISLQFEGMNPGAGGPEVYAIAPVGTMSLVPTTQDENLKQNAGLQLGGTVEVGGVAATGTAGWKKSVSDTSNEMTVTGSIDLRGRNWGKSNCTFWTLLENNTTNTGVPPFMRMAVLLKRENNNPFQCVIKVDASVDFYRPLEQVYGGKGWEGKDDPVLFDPKLEGTNNLRKYDIEELGAFNLESVCVI